MTVYDGQYIELSRCYFDPTPIKLEKIYTDADTIKAVQEALNEAGYDCGTPDGSAGPATKGAILNYQKDHSLPESGTVSESLVRSLFGEPAETEDDSNDSKSVKEAGITWTQLARTPEQYIGQEVAFQGEVVQTIEGDGIRK